MILLADKKSCTGCAACVQSCSHSAIVMIQDDEGFLFPKIDATKCIECGLCEQLCPELHPIDRLDYSNQEAYAFISKQDRKKSSSGGAFSVFARWIIAQGGVVYGASMNEQFQVRHIGISTCDDLDKLRGSKYVQSDIVDAYKQVFRHVKNGRKVLFTGTGCQVAGLYAFLRGKRYEGLLYTLDLVCHGTPSQRTFDSYIGKLRKKVVHKGEDIKEFHFRKLDSWSIVPTVQLSEKKEHILTLSENSYMDAFFKGIIFRESCFHCQYCNTWRIGTFTIADFWGIGRHGIKFKKNVSCGVSLVIDNQGIMPHICKELTLYAYIEKRNMGEAMEEQHNLKEPMARLPQRDFAVKMMNDENVSLDEFCKKCGLPYRKTVKWCLTKTIKDCICTLGLYNIYKTLIYKLGK